MDEEFQAETSIDDAIEAFMQSEPEDDLIDDLPDGDDEEETIEVDEDEVEDDQDDDLDEDPSDDQDADDEEDEDESTDEEADEKPSVADDTAEVAVTVDGKEHRVSVADLKRLYGQEASLTTKSQALAEQRRIVEAQGQHVATVLQKQYEAAKADNDKYKDVDLFRASRELEPEDFDALRAAKENAANRLTALEREGQEFMHKSQETRMNLLRETAKESLKEITKAIPEWNDELYSSVRTYAVSQGMDPDDVNTVVEPAAIKMMHKAMMYDKVQEAKPKVKKKIAKAPKKVLRKGDNPTDTKTSKLKAKRKTVVENGGDIDDVAALFMAEYDKD